MPRLGHASCSKLIAAFAGCGSCGSNDTHYSFKDPSGEPIKAVVRILDPLAYAELDGSGHNRTSTQEIAQVVSSGEEPYCPFNNHRPQARD